MVLLAEAFQKGKANPYPEYVSIQMRTNTCLFHMKNVQCHHPTLVNWPQSSLPRNSTTQRARVGFSVDRLDIQQYHDPGHASCRFFCTNVTFSFKPLLIALVKISPFSLLLLQIPSPYLAFTCQLLTYPMTYLLSLFLSPPSRV